MSRRFYFMNSLNKEPYELTDQNFKVFLNEPKGLGFRKSLSTIRVGDKESVVSSSFNMPEPSGELIFYDYDRDYQDYQDFIEYISHTPLRFYNIPDNSVTAYYIECEVIEVKKTERKPDDMVMRCPISIKGLSLWLNETESSVTLRNNIEGDGKHYPLERPYYYPGNDLSSFEINNVGNLSTGFKMEINGRVENPILSAYSVDGARYGAVRINGEYTYILFNTENDENAIYLERDGVTIANPANNFDFTIRDGVSDIPFFKLKVGKTIMQFTCSDIASFDGSITISWSAKYSSV